MRLSCWRREIGFACPDRFRAAKEDMNALSEDLTQALLLIKAAGYVFPYSRGGELHLPWTITWRMATSL
jgi:hypothetical protein